MGCTTRYVSPRLCYENKMTNNIWLLMDHARNEFLVETFTVAPRDEREMTPRDEREMTLKSPDGFVSFAAGAAHGIRDTLLVTEYTIRRAHAAQMIAYSTAMEEHKLRLLLEAAGVLADGVLEKILSPAVRGMIEKAPGLAAVVRHQVIKELDSLLKSWKKG